jgi:hypothetical protein
MSAERPARIWYQSFVDPEEQRPYMRRLEDSLAAQAAPGVRFEVHGVSPPDRYLSSLARGPRWPATTGPHLEATEEAVAAGRRARRVLPTICVQRWRVVGLDPELGHIWDVEGGAIVIDLSVGPARGLE